MNVSTPAVECRVRQVAEQKKGVRFTALLHHIYAINTLSAALYELERDAAPGVEGETWEHYGQELEANSPRIVRACESVVEWSANEVIERFQRAVCWVLQS